MAAEKLREVKVQIRVRETERQRADRVAEKLGISLSAAYRQAMNRLFDELFTDRSKKESS